MRSVVKFTGFTEQRFDKRNSISQHYLEPPMKLKEALKDFKLPEEVFTTLSHGETKHFASSQ